MERINNNRRCILVLPESKLILKPGASVAVKELTSELQKAISEGWINLEGESTSSNAPAHDWEVDYSHSDDGQIIVSDKISGKQITGEIAERKADEHFTPKEIGTVKKQQFWPSATGKKLFKDLLITN